jgi:hypothetical protein
MKVFLVIGRTKRKNKLVASINLSTDEKEAFDKFNEEHPFFQEISITEIYKGDLKRFSIESKDVLEQMIYLEKVKMREMEHADIIQQYYKNNGWAINKLYYEPRSNKWIMDAVTGSREFTIKEVRELIKKCKESLCNNETVINAPQGFCNSCYFANNPDK